MLLGAEDACEGIRVIKPLLELLRALKDAPPPGEKLFALTTPTTKTKRAVSARNRA
jgi:hypothetical protein